MKLLLDTHIFLWYISGDPKLPEAARNTIRDPSNVIYLSVASVWEDIVKYQLGKLPLPQSAAQYVPRQREQHQIFSLPLDEASVARLATLPSIHRDPFDRMLVCQALEHQLVIVTVDNTLRDYPVTIL